MIPKIIHYCWFGKGKYPDSFNLCMPTWKKHFKDYEFVLWDESNAPMNSPYVKSAYEKKRYAFVSDYIRMWALYEFGGIYLDTDVFIVKNFDDLLCKDIIVGWERPANDYINAAIFGASKEHCFVGDILSKYETLNFIDENIEELKIPLIMTEVYRQKYINDFTPFSYEYFYPFPYVERHKKNNYMLYKTDNTYAIHLWDLSWKKKYEKYLNYLKKLILTGNRAEI